MTFSTAVYDIHPGDRRQMERILKKETLDRTNDGDNLYSESFGSTQSLLLAPMKFDAFFIDGTNEAQSCDASENLRIASLLREKGVVAPITLFFHESITLPTECEYEDIYIYSKPITPSIVHALLDKWMAEKSTRSPRYEIRGDKDTYYVDAREVMYASSTGGSSVDVYLTKGRYAHVLEPMSYIFTMFEKDLSFVRAGKNTMINMHHIVSADSRSFLMSDDHRIVCNPIEFLRVKSIWKKFTAL